MYVLFFGLHVTNNLQVYNLQLVYNVACNLELCTNTPKKRYLDKIDIP